MTTQVENTPELTKTVSKHIETMESLVRKDEPVEIEPEKVEVSETKEIETSKTKKDLQAAITRKVENIQQDLENLRKNNKLEPADQQSQLEAIGRDMDNIHEIQTELNQLVAISKEEEQKIVQDTLEKINSRNASDDEDMPTTVANPGNSIVINCNPKVPKVDTEKVKDKSNQMLANLKSNSTILKKGMISQTEKLGEKMKQLELKKEIKSGSKLVKKATIDGTKATIEKTKSMTDSVVKATQKQFQKSKVAANKARFINDGVTRIPLKKFIPDTVKCKMNDQAVITVTAEREMVQDGVNGERKSFIQIEETCKLPEYLIDNDMLGQVQSKLINGFLVVTYPLDPTLESEENEDRNNGIIVVPIERVEE